MNHLRVSSLLVLAALVAGPAIALEGPKVVVTYSLRDADGGAKIRSVTETPFGSVTNVFIDSDHPETRGYRQLWSDPLYVVIEYTADPKTEQVVAGPVELIDVNLNEQFWVKTGGGHLGCPDGPPCNGVSTNTVIVERLARKGVGTLRVDEDCVIDDGEGGSIVAQQDWTFIEWDNSEGMNYQSVSDCSELDGNDPERELDPTVDYTMGCITQCLFNSSRGESICELAQGETPWPRLEPLTPKDKPLPPTSVFANAQLGDELHTDNCTPADPLPEVPEAGANAAPVEVLEKDDIAENADSQAVTFASWYAVEASRQYVPEPSTGWLAAGAFATLGTLRRRSSRRS